MPRAGAILKDITIVGTDYHDETCTPCPAGFHSAAGASSCTACGLNHFSAKGAATCNTCPAGYTSLAKSSQCMPRPQCTEHDYIFVYSQCKNGLRNQTAVYLQPQVEPLALFFFLFFFWYQLEFNFILFKICTSATALPDTTEVSCAECPQGTYMDSTNSSCIACGTGEYYQTSKCVESSVGEVTIRKKYFFVDGSEDWPEGSFFLFFSFFLFSYFLYLYFIFF